MTDLSRLQSQIAELARRDHLVPSQPTGRASAFLARLAGQRFDALVTTGAEITTTIGTCDDLRTFAQQMQQDENADPTVFICASHHDPDAILFCGTDGQDVLVLRTRDIRMEILMKTWRAAH